MQTAGTDSLATSQSAPRTVESVLAIAKLRIIARIQESERVTDLAIPLGSIGLAVVRCVDRAQSDDRVALATMLAEGDFVWAGLVYSDQAGTDWPGDVEAFHLSEVTRLIERLHQLERSAAS